MTERPSAVLRKIDCIRLYVPSMADGLAFYRDALGHRVVWQTECESGLQFPDSEAEIVLHTNRQAVETDIAVESAEDEAEIIRLAGGKIIVEPFDIQIGRCVVVEDPFGNALVLLDFSKGLLKVDADGRVVGNQRPNQ